MKKLTASAIAFILFIIIVVLATIVLSACKDLKNVKADRRIGIDRTAVLMDYNGDTIKTWRGKFGNEYMTGNQIFFDLDGKRVCIRGGIFVSEEK